MAAPTRIKVERLLEAHAYRRTTRSAHEAPLIEIVFHELESIWAMELIRGVENVAKTHAPASSSPRAERATRRAPNGWRRCSNAVRSVSSWSSPPCPAR